MIFKDKFYTIMVVPSATSRVRKVKVSGRLVNILAGCGLLLAATTIWFSYDYLRVKGQVSELDSLRSETRAQRLKLNAFAQQIIDVEKEMSRLRKFDTLIRGAFDLNKGRPQSQNMGGIGGSTSPDLSEYPEMLESKVGELSSQMEKDLGRIKEETTTREASLSELLGFLQEKRSLMLATPSLWPVKGLVTSGFQMRLDPFSRRWERHAGLDIASNEGQPIIAPADGVITTVARTSGYGKVLSIDHGYGYTTSFGHNSRIAVRGGQRVRRGDVISYVGNTGRSTGPHLHYEIHKNGIPVNPSEYLLD